MKRRCAANALHEDDEVGVGSDGGERLGLGGRLPSFAFRC